MKKWQQCQQLLKKDVSTNKRQQRPETKKIYAPLMLFLKHFRTNYIEEFCQPPSKSIKGFPPSLDRKGLL